MYETHRKSLLHPPWEEKLELQLFRRDIRSYWASVPDQQQPHTRQYQQMRLNAAARECVWVKSERHLPGFYTSTGPTLSLFPSPSEPLFVPFLRWFLVAWQRHSTNRCSRRLHHQLIDSPGPSIVDYDVSLPIILPFLPLVALGTSRLMAAPVPFGACYTADSITLGYFMPTLRRPCKTYSPVQPRPSP